MVLGEDMADLALATVFVGLGVQGFKISGFRVSGFRVLGF